MHFSAAMQAPTHILAGVVLGKTFQWQQHRGLAFVLMAVSGLLSHSLLDRIAIMTYHPPDADFSSAFWVGFHLAVLLATVTLVYLFGSTYTWGILFAVLPDADWIFIHGQKLAGVHIPFYDKPLLHTAVHYIIDNLPLLDHLSMLPDWRLLPLAATGEIVLCLLFWLVYRKMESYRRNIHFR